MKSVILTYTTKGLTTSQRSIISKIVNGYADKSNYSRYNYKRPGLMDQIPHIKITKNTFIIKEKDLETILKELKKRRATPKTWPIDIKKEYFLG